MTRYPQWSPRAAEAEEGWMSTFRFQIAVSLDGYAAGPDQSEDNPLGVGGMDLHRWVFELEAWRKQQGRKGAR
jgi:hypothetical protein